MSKVNKSAMEAASAYLASGMRTTEEVRRRLKDRQYDSDEIEEAIDELTELHYLDDYQYALRYYEYNREKKRGSARAAAALAEKGVEEQIIKNAREDFLFENRVDEFADALCLALAETDGREADDKLKAKIARRLESKGYTGRDIIRVLAELGKDRDDIG